MGTKHHKPYQIAVDILREFETITGPTDQVLLLTEDVAEAIDKAFAEGYQAGYQACVEKAHDGDIV